MRYMFFNWLLKVHIIRIMTEETSMSFHNIGRDPIRFSHIISLFICTTQLRKLTNQLRAFDYIFQL